MGDLAGGLLPDLRAGGAVVGEPVGVVGVLIDVAEAIWIVAGQLASASNGAVGALAGVGPIHFSPVGTQNPLALRGDVGRHGELDGKAERRAEHGEGNSGVAAGGVEQSLARPEQAAVADIGNHGCGGAVFDAAAGIGPLGLGEERDALKAAKDMVQANEGRVADALRQGGAGFGLR